MASKPSSGALLAGRLVRGCPELTATVGLCDVEVDLYAHARVAAPTPFVSRAMIDTTRRYTSVLRSLLEHANIAPSKTRADQLDENPVYCLSLILRGLNGEDVVIPRASATAHDGELGAPILIGAEALARTTLTIDYPSRGFTLRG